MKFSYSYQKINMLHIHLYEIYILAVDGLSKEYAQIEEDFIPTEDEENSSDYSLPIVPIDSSKIIGFFFLI